MEKITKTRRKSGNNDNCRYDNYYSRGVCLGEIKKKQPETEDTKPEKSEAFGFNDGLEEKTELEVKVEKNTFPNKRRRGSKGDDNL